MQSRAAPSPGLRWPSDFAPAAKPSKTAFNGRPQGGPFLIPAGSGLQRIQFERARIRYRDGRAEDEARILFCAHVQRIQGRPAGRHKDVVDAVALGQFERIRQQRAAAAATVSPSPGWPQQTLALSYLSRHT